MNDVTVGQAIGSEGYKVNHEGKTYTCHLLTQADKTKFEEWVIDKAFSTLAPLRKYDPDAYWEDKTALIQAVKRGSYGFHSQNAMDAMKTPAGGLALMAILFGLSELDMAKCVNADSEAFGVAFQSAIAASMPKAKEDAIAG